jgi:hypothetical protein
MIWTWYAHGACGSAHNGVAPACVHSLVDWEVRVVQSLREVDGAAELEVEAHADSLVFEDHLQWSERRHHLLLMNRRSRLGEEDSFYFGFCQNVGRAFLHVLITVHHQLNLPPPMSRRILTMGTRTFASRRVVPDVFSSSPNTAEFVAAAGSASSIPRSMGLPEVVKTFQHSPY